MALSLGAYCISSIRAARRDAQGPPSSSTTQPTGPRAHSYREKGTVKSDDPAWMQQAMMESQRETK